MKERRNGRLRTWTPLLFSLIMIFGMVLGFNLRDTLRSKRDILTIVQRNDRLEQIIDLISEKYVDSVNTNVLFEDAINGILSHLDPHTVYIPPNEMAAVNEDLEGSFFGIGVEFSIIRDTIQVTSVIDNGPAQRAGVDIGDKLIKVEDSVVAGTGITSERIIKMLRGKEHSKVLVTLESPGRKNLKRIIIERGAIPLYSVDASLMLGENTGYIKINRFSATTFEEFHKALKSLKQAGMKALILDLRQNPGGYLDAATEIADQFLDDKKLLVYTKGRHAPKMEFTAEEKGDFEEGRLVILVDESSASASEILAGAIQDWDRGVIVGRRTYGKGLVQEQYEMENGAALRLTIAKYYTPSGRSIQRSYAKGKKAYSEDWAHRFETGELTGTDTSFVLPDTTKYYTSNKRPVYGGGGINPDVYVPYDTSKLNSSLLSLVFSDEAKDIIWDYFLKNRAALKEYKSVQNFKVHFKTDELLAKFSKELPQKLKTSFQKVMREPERKSYFEVQLKAQIARYLFRNKGYYEVYSEGDITLQKALDIIRSPEYLKIIDR